MGYLSRKPTPNELLNSSNPWGSQDPYLDDIAVLAFGLGKRCSVCNRVVIHRYLKHKNERPYCPDHFPKGEENGILG